MVEVLVAVLLLAGGLIGLAALQGKEMRFGQNAYLTSQAALLVYDLADRMRANRAGVIGGFYLGAAADNACVSDETATVKSCTPAQLAADDLYHWTAAVKAVLPPPTGPTPQVSITNGKPIPAGVGCDGPPMAVIQIYWNLRDFSIDPSNKDQSYSLCLTNI